MKQVVICLALCLPLVARAQTKEDHEAVRRAVLNYVEGFYEGDSTKIAMGVYPEVNKRGFYVPRGAEPGDYRMSPMTFEQMIAYTRNVRQSGRVTPESAPKEIEIYEVLDKTASVKLTAQWGIDYMLLAKSDGEWKIWHLLYTLDINNIAGQD